MPTDGVRTNLDITAPEILLIDENGESLGVVSNDQAQYLAYERELDLVEVAPNAKPPVARLQDYSKQRYRMEKQLKQQRVKGKAPELKEVRLSLKIGEHDLMVKVNRAKEFLEKGSKVRVSLQLKGREMIFKDKGLAILDRFRDLAGSEYEQAPTRLGNRFNAIIKQGKSNAKTEDQ